MNLKFIGLIIYLIAVNQELETSILTKRKGGLALANTNNVICWSKGLRFDSNHFRATPTDSMLTYYDTQADAAAYIYINVLKMDKSSTDYSITACFNPDSSWITKDLEMLYSHEKYHFDIAELYARKIRKSVDSLKNIGTLESEVFNKVISDKHEKYENFSKFFDLRTMHGSAIIPQENIVKKVHSMLDELKVYELDTTQCNCE